MSDYALLITTGVVFLSAGCIKGIVGFGLPLVAVGIMTAIVGLPTAIALLLVPAFVTNLWQGFAGAHTAILLRRFWTMFLPTVIFIWPGTLALSRVNVNYLSALLAVLLILYAIFTLTHAQFSVPQHMEKRLNPIMGTFSGLLAGLTGAFTVPGVVYLQSTQMPREQLVQAMGILFTLSTIGLALSMGSQNLLSKELGLVSLAAVVPTMIGMVLGGQIRKRISERTFRLVFLYALALLGFYILVRSVTALV